MDKVLELAKKAGLPTLAWEEETKAFYTLACADLNDKVVSLEAENAKLRDLMREARDTCKASIVESGISAMRKEYREDLTKRLSAALGESE